MHGIQNSESRTLVLSVQREMLIERNSFIAGSSCLGLFFLSVACSFRNLCSYSQVFVDLFPAVAV